MSQIQVPVSIGELLDKITILQIKQKHIQDGAKLSNINKELSLLTKTAEMHKISQDHPEFVDLYAVNQELWNIEDEIRDMERNKNFGHRFVELARSVYIQNDKRFLLKSKLNKIYHSELVEEKSYKEY